MSNEILSRAEEIFTRAIADLILLYDPGIAETLIGVCPERPPATQGSRRAILVTVKGTTERVRQVSDVWFCPDGVDAEKVSRSIERVLRDSAEVPA